MREKKDRWYIGLVLSFILVITSLVPVMAVPQDNQQEKTVVEYFYATEDNFDGVQNIIAKIDFKGKEINKVELTYEEQGQTKTKEADVVSTDFASFQLEGEIQDRNFVKLTVYGEQVEEIDLLTKDEQEVEIASEEVQDVVQEAVVQETKEELPVVSNSLGERTIDETATETEVQEDVGAQEGVVDTNEVSTRATSTQSLGKYIVVIDAGHGGSDPGAVGTLNGTKYNEKDFTLKIAKYTQQELASRFPELTVYMTRTSDRFIELTERVNYAASMGAHLFVSMHINSFTNSSVKGARIFIPNDSPYNKYTNTQAKLLAKEALKELAALGFRNGGFYENDSNQSTYPDGSAADYYSVIRNARKKGITGVIFEHGFISNPDDLAFLAKDSNLKNIGIANAKSIAAYLKANGDDLVNAMQGVTLNPANMPQGWNKVNDKWYYVTAQKKFATSWLKVDGVWYYFNAAGVMQTGWQKVDGKWYYMSQSGAMQTGWIKVGQTSYYLQGDGAMYTGWLNWNDKWYLLDSASGAMVTGWAKSGDVWYYMNTDGAMRTGWLTVDKKTYYLKDSGAMVTNWYTVDGVKYYFNKSGERANGLVTINNDRFYFDENGIYQTSWIKVGTKWYFANAEGKLQKGWITDGKQKYFLGDDYIMVVGWKQIDSKWYYFNTSGLMQTGMITVDGKKYLLDHNGWMQVGWQQVSNDWYYFGGNGEMKTSWIKVNNLWYYLNQEGVRQYGWLDYNNARYYLDEKGVMQVGWVKLDDTWYYFEESGVMQTGWLNLNNIWYYLNEDGKMQTGWITVDKTRYYLNSMGVMQTGWLKLENTWYFLKGNGAMQQGWLKWNGKFYFFKADGVMATDEWIGNDYVDENGVWIPDKEKPVSKSNEVN